MKLSVKIATAAQTAKKDRFEIRVRGLRLNVNRLKRGACELRISKSQYLDDPRRGYCVTSKKVPEIAMKANVVFRRESKLEPPVPIQG
jgi:hypothetical protein